MTRDLFTLIFRDISQNTPKKWIVWWRNLFQILGQYFMAFNKMPPNQWALISIVIWTGCFLKLSFFRGAFQDIGFGTFEGSFRNTVLLCLPGILRETVRLFHNSLPYTSILIVKLHFYLHKEVSSKRQRLSHWYQPLCCTTPRPT